MTGRIGTTGRREIGRCTRGTVAVKPFKSTTSSNPVDLGWYAVRTRARLSVFGELLDWFVTLIGRPWLGRLAADPVGRPEPGPLEG